MEDLISTGKSSLNAVRALKEAGINVKGMVAIFTYGFDIAAKNFEKEKNTGFGVVDFQVTNLGMWNRQTFEGKTSIVVVDRTTVNPA